MDALQSIDEVSVDDSEEQSDNNSENSRRDYTECDVDFASDDSDIELVIQVHSWSLAYIITVL